MQARADEAHEQEVKQIEEQLRSKDITNKERKQLKKQQKQLKKADASQRLATLQSKETEFGEGSSTSESTEGMTTFENPLDEA